MDDLAATVRDLRDRQEIHDCLLRYCRGIDRLDAELMLSAYHADAIDDHGLVVLGAADFVDWAIDFHRTNNPIHQHGIGNLTIDLDGDVAHSECYYTFIGTRSGGPSTLSFGRYVDRLEKREGRWAIAMRCCFTEAVQDIQPSELPAGFADLLKSNGPQARDRTDASYHRPLRPNRLPSAN